ncbi:MAG: chitinase [Clostridiales bacterium]|nr:chitinase [Clostridiales bacterium]
MKHYFVGYVTLKGMYNVTDTQAKKLTHLNLAFAPMKDGETVMTLDDRQIEQLSRLRCANPSLAILVSTGGGGDRGHGEATRTAEGLDRLVSSTLRLVEKYGLDGIDCDWEFPGDTGILEEKYQHTALFAEYRRRLDALSLRTGKKYWLTTAAGAGEWYLNRTEIGQSHQYLDFINLMTYDSDTDSFIAGHHTHLYESKAPGCPRIQSADHNIRIMVEAGVPLDKILMGCAFYSHRWDKVPDVNHGLYQKSPWKNMFGPSYTEIALKYENKMDFVKYWDEDAKAPFLYNGYTFISYDDPLSVRLKCEYAVEKGMAGAFYWVHDSDLGGELFDAVYDALNNA